MPIAREAITADSGIFQPVLAEDYCLMWEAGPAPTALDYRVRGRPARHDAAHERARRTCCSTSTAR